MRPRGHDVDPNVLFRRAGCPVIIGDGKGGISSEDDGFRSTESSTSTATGLPKGRRVVPMGNAILRTGLSNAKSIIGFTQPCLH